MNKKKKSNDFQKQKRIHPVMIGFLLMLCILVVFAAIQYTIGLRTQKEKPVIKEPAGFATRIKKLSLNDLIETTKKNFATLGRYSLPVQIEKLDQQQILANQIEELDPTKSLYADKVRVTAYTILDAHNVAHEFGRGDVRDKLIQLANKMVQSQHIEVVRDGFFAIANATATDLCKDPGLDELEGCRDVIGISLDKLAGDLKWIAKLKEVFAILKVGGVSDQRKYLLSHVAEKLLTSEYAPIRAEGLLFNSTACFGDVDWELLDSSLRSRSPTSINALKEHLQTLKQNPNVSEGVYKSFFGLLERNSKFCLENGMEAEMLGIEKALDQLVVEKSKTLLRSRLSNMTTRLQMLNKEFSFEGENMDGELVNNRAYADKSVLIVYFSFQQEESAQFLAKLFRTEVLDHFDLVGVLLDEPTETQLAILMKRFPNSCFIKASHATSFNEAFIVDLAPFVLLIDEKHQLMASGLDVADLQELAENKLFRD